ncbi:MAG: Dabb family protein [Bacteroidetes bacterium]|nr:Dabb family protein [Bacteroidota bacterium]
MLIHNVYFWLKDEVTPSQKTDFEKGIKDFLDSVDEVQKYQIGIPASTPDRDVVDHSFGVSMFVWFNNVEDHNIYQVHPAHDKFVKRFKDLWAKVQVLDSEMF